MKIAFIAHLSELSGAGVALMDICRGLQSQGIKGTLVLPGDGPLLQRARELNLDTITIANPEVDITSAGLLDKLRLVKQRATYIRNLRRHLKSGGYTLAYVNSSATVFAGIAAKLAGLPIAWHVHETLANQSRAAHIKAGLIRRLSRAILYASDSAMKAFPHPASLPGMVVLNPIDTDALLPIGEQRLQDKGEPSQEMLLANGTFHRKGTDILLAALGNLKEGAPVLMPQVQITGPSPFPDAFARQLSALVEKYGLADAVQFVGVQPSLIPLYQRSALYISPSRNEALPIAIVEAMACGVPVIATDVGDCRNLLDSGECGWVVPPEDPVALAYALREALGNPELARAKAICAYEKVLRVYAAPDFWSPLTRFLQQVCA